MKFLAHMYGLRKLLFRILNFCLLTPTFHPTSVENTCSRDIDRDIHVPDVCQCLVVQTPMDDLSKNKPSTSMIHTACKSKLCTVVWSQMHPCSGNWVAIRHAVVYYVWASHAYSAGTKCWFCSALRKASVWPNT